MSKPQVNLVTNRRSCEEHVDLICAAWQKGVESIIETGALINVAQQEVGEGKFEADVLPELPFSRSTAYRLKTIASHPVLSNVAHGRLLPPSWRTLDELTKVPQTKLLAAIKSGEVHPEMERKDVRALLPPKPKPEQRDDDLPPNYEGSVDPEVSAEAMKARFAAMDDHESASATLPNVANKGNGIRPATDVVATCVAEVKSIVSAAMAELAKQEDRLGLLDRVEGTIVRMRLTTKPDNPERWREVRDR